MAYAFWVYRRAEFPVPGSRWMALSRGFVLLVIVALLFDPRLPGPREHGSVDRWVALDASLSMSATSSDAAPWDEASARADELVRDGWALVTFGGVQTAAGAGPVGTSTRLVPLLERAAEAGVREVRVLSDGRFEDAVGIRAALATLPLSVELEPFGGDVLNVGILSFDVPDAPHPGEPVAATAELHGLDVDSATLELRADGRLLDSRRVAIPSPGLRSTVTVEIVPPESEERIRYTARLTAADDAFAADDEAVAYGAVGRAEGALVLVSFAPDWEPRYLLPVLEEATGLPAFGYLRVGTDRFVPLGRALDRGVQFDSATVSRAVRDAALVVAHGLDANADAWARAVVRAAPRGVFMPSDADGARLVGVETSAPRPGEWYAAGDVPPSPLAAELAGASLLGLPPVSNLLVPTVGVPPGAPLHVQLRGTGTPHAALHLAEPRTGRRAITLASGFWRWAMREGQGSDAYRRLWSGVAGWLLRDAAAVAAEPRPTHWVVPRGDAVRFSAPPQTAFAITVSRDGAVVADTAGATGPLAFGELAPGTYAYTFETADGASGGGRFDVAATTTELAQSRAPFEASSRFASGGMAGRLGRPLRTSVWPYLLVILLLCSEWVARRRSGLR